MRVQILSSTEELARHIADWKELAINASETNVFFEPDFFLPAIKHLATDSVFCLLIWRDNARKSQLTGFFPLVRDFGYKYLPLKYIRLWKHSQCFLTTPLVHKDYCKESLKFFLEWLGSSSEGSNLLALDGFHGGGAFCNALISCMNSDGAVHEEMDSYKRSFLNCDLSSEEYMKTAFKDKSLSRFQKKRRTLERQGEVRFSICTERDDIESWIDQFLSLEKSGWKGREGSALACSANEEAFFRETVRNFFQSKQLLMTKLELDDQVAAMQCLLASAHCAFIFKIAYNEALGKYSPGTILDLELLKHVLDNTQIRTIDSCTVPGSSLDRVFKDERVIRSWVLSSPHLRSRSIVSAFPYLKKASSLVKSIRPLRRLS